MGGVSPGHPIQCSVQDDWMEQLSTVPAMLVASCMILGRSRDLPKSPGPVCEL